MCRRTSKVSPPHPPQCSPPPSIIDTDKTCPSVENGTSKVKASIPLKKIVMVNEFSEEDQKKYKKLAKANDLGIKLVFKKRYQLDKAYVPDDNEQDMSDGEEGAEGEDLLSDEEEEVKGKTTSNRSKSRGATPANAANAKKTAASKAAELDTWYLVCDSKKDQEDCLEALIISAKALNARYVQNPQNEVA